jgi:flagellar assembly protein FliH
MASFPSQSAPLDVRKFQFSDFEDESLLARMQQPEPEPVYNTTDLEATRAASDKAGYERGVAETLASLEADMARNLEAVEASIAMMATDRKRQEDFIAAEAVRLAADIARRILPVMAQTHVLAEIEGLLAICMKERSEEPRLVVRLPDELLDPVSTRLERLVRESGFAGKPILLADPSLKRTQARVEWSNGGAEWNFDAMLNEMESAARALASGGRKTVKDKKPDIKAQADAAAEEIKDDERH